MSQVLTSSGVRISVVSAPNQKKVPIVGYTQIPQVIEISDLDFGVDVVDSTSYHNMRRKIGVPSRFDSGGVHFLKVNATRSQDAENLWDRMAYDSQIRNKAIWLRIDMPFMSYATFIPIRPIPTCASNIVMNDRIISTLRFTLAGDVQKVAVTPVIYEKARNRQKIYAANFSSNYFNKNKSGGTWKIGINSGATVAEDTALIINAAKYQAHPYTDQRYIGTFPLYTLENKTYTLDFELFKEPTYFRPRVYFANGVFIDSETGGKMNGVRCNPAMYCLGFQVQHSRTTGKMQYQFVDNGNDEDKSTNLIQPNKIWEVDENGERSAKLKVVLKGGAKKENVTIYNGNGTIQKDGVSTWTGDIIPIYFTVYCDDNKAAEGLIYQPADEPLVFGIGSYEKPTDIQYYGVRDLNIYKGDMVNADISFTIDGIEYTVPKGTPWEIFIDNNSNLGLYYQSYSEGSGIFDVDSSLELDGVIVKKYDLIVSGGNYATGPQIPFSIDGVNYSITQGSTWKKFVDKNSSRGFSIKDGLVYLNDKQIWADNIDEFYEVYETNTIEESGIYTTQPNIVGYEFTFTVKFDGNSKTHTASRGMTWEDITNPDHEYYDSSFSTDSSDTILYSNGEIVKEFGIPVNLYDEIFNGTYTAHTES